MRGDEDGEGIKGVVGRGFGRGRVWEVAEERRERCWRLVRGDGTRGGGGGGGGGGGVGGGGGGAGSRQISTSRSKSFPIYEYTS